MQKTTFFAALFLFVISVSAFSQVNYRPGYIITNDQDTINGKIDFRRNELMSGACSFKTEGGETRAYSPLELHGYYIDDKCLFESYIVDGIPRFLEVLVRGKLSILYFKNNDKNRYFFIKDGGEITELRYYQRKVYIDEYGISSDGNKYVILASDTTRMQIFYVGNYAITSQEFKMILLRTFKDTPELADYIKKLKLPEHKGLILLAKKYHELKGGDQELVIYHNSYYKSDFELSAGWSGMSYYRFRTAENFLMFSFKGYQPLESEKFAFGYGLQYASVNSAGNTFQILRIPLSLRFQYPGHRIRPYAALGLNIYGVHDGSRFEIIENFVPAYTIGAAIQVHEFLHVTVRFEGDLLWDPDFTISNTASFSRGICLGIMGSF